MEQNQQKTMVPRSDEEIVQLTKRLKRIEGQVRGINKMVEEGRYCIDILTQILAVEAAIKKVGFSLVERHTKHCVTKAVADGNGEEAVEELMNVVQRFAK